MEQNRGMKLFYRIASVLFVGLLLLPLSDELWHYSGDAGTEEQRVMASFPEFRYDSLQVFTKKFEEYYSDHFGFRSHLVNIGAKIKYKVFRASPSPERVACGSEDWLFLTGQYYEINQDLSRGNRYTEQGLKDKVKEWETRNAELKAMGIPYYNAFWPDKHYIYPEYMPFSMKLISGNLPPRCDQAIDYLSQSKSAVHMIDVRQELLEAKKSTRVYSKRDSHWNEYGAFIGYSKLMETIAKDFPDLKPYTLSDFKVIWEEPAFEGDLANIIKVKTKEPEPVFIFKKQLPPSEKQNADAYPKKTIIYSNPGSATSKRILIYRDSFTNALIPFLNLHFREVVLIWDTAYSIDMVNRVKPDLVLEGYASRYFR